MGSQMLIQGSQLTTPISCLFWTEKRVNFSPFFPELIGSGTQSSKINRFLGTHLTHAKVPKIEEGKIYQTMYLTDSALTIDYSAMNSTEEDLEPYRPDKLDKSSRRSVLVWYLKNWIRVIHRWSFEISFSSIVKLLSKFNWLFSFYNFGCKNWWFYTISKYGGLFSDPNFSSLFHFLTNLFNFHYYIDWCKKNLNLPKRIQAFSKQH